MKSLLFASLLLLAQACEENVPSYDKLNQAERDYINSRARVKCVDDAKTDLANFKKTSGLELGRYKRGDFWKLTIPGTTTPDYLYVWKVTTAATYFLYQENVRGTVYSNFFKMTPTFNGEMLDDLLVKKCASKIPAISIGSTSYSVKYLDEMKPEGTTKFRVDTTYTGKDTLPAFISVFSKKLFKEKLDDKDKVVSSETVDYTVKYEGDNPTMFDTYSEYGNRQLCGFKYTNGTPKTVEFPFSLNCVTSGDPNASFGDPTLNLTVGEL